MFHIQKISLWASVVFLVFTVLSCDNNDVDENPSSLTGSGKYIYNDYAPFADKPINCFYYVPANSTSTTPVFMALPGASRNAQSLRDGLIASADQKGFIVLALEFSETYFPGSDMYNMANIFEDGDDPSPATLNPEEEWTFSVLDPIFEDFKNIASLSVATYDVFGHSAGAQLIHRYLIFQPSSSVKRVVSSAAGWYAVPDVAIEFPYGLLASPAETTPSQPYFSKECFIIVGANDTDPNSFNLRHTPEADAQGNNRLERAQHFFQESYQIAQGKNEQFNWHYLLVPNVGHDQDAMANFAVDQLY